MKFKLFLAFSFTTGLLALALGCSGGPSSPSGSATDTPTVATSPTSTFTVTGTVPMPTDTPSPTLTGTSTFTPTITGTPTNTATSNSYPIYHFNPSSTPPFTSTITATPTVTGTPSNTATITATPTFTITGTLPSTDTPTNTGTNTSTATLTSTSTTTVTSTPTPTDTPCLNAQGTPCTPVMTPTPYSATVWASFVTFGSFGTGNGQFEFPMGVAVGAGFVAISDEVAQNIQVFNSGLTYLYTIPAHGGAPDLFGLAMDSFGELYSADYGSQEVDGYFLGPTTYTYDYTWNDQGHLSGPDGVKIDSNGNLVVADFSNQTLYNLRWTDDAVLNQADVPFPPNDVALDAAGSLYVADSGGQVDEYSNGYAFMNSFNGSAWAVPLGGSPTGPSGLGVDSQGNLFISDTGNGRVVYADAQGDFLGEIGGFILPNDLALDPLDDLFIADGDGTTYSRVYEYQR